MLCTIFRINFARSTIMSNIDFPIFPQIVTSFRESEARYRSCRNIGNVCCYVRGSIRVWILKICTCTEKEIEMCLPSSSTATPISRNILVSGNFHVYTRVDNPPSCEKFVIYLNFSLTRWLSCHEYTYSVSRFRATRLLVCINMFCS